ncbi:MAG TPA: dihydroneopterin aldolase [Candidatus Limnocylindrales bacterium]
MTDHISLSGMRFRGKHGVLEEELQTSQPFEVDVELWLDLSPAGRSDDLSQTADYRAVFDICRETIEGPSFRLIEALAEEIAGRVIARFETLEFSEVVVRVRKPEVALPRDLDFAAVEIRRRRPRRS